MAQALLIKTANTSVKTVGDIVGIFDDTHKFSTYELSAFNVAKIEGKREDVVAKLNEIQIPMAKAWKTDSAKWSLTRPENKIVWKDTDEKWYFLDAMPKYKWSMALLSESEKTTLEKDDTGIARDAAYKKIVVNPGEWDEKNQVEATDLNAVQVTER